MEMSDNVLKEIVTPRPLFVRAVVKVHVTVANVKKCVDMGDSAHLMNI